jgi:hypothetical protein
VELALVREPYKVQGNIRILYILSNMNPQVCNCCMPPVPNLEEGGHISMGD